MPEILAEDSDYGVTRGDICGYEIPISGIMGDQQAALFGQGGFTPGSTKCTHGTGSFIDFNVGAEPIMPGNGLDGRPGWVSKYNTSYILEGGSFVTGSAVEWLINNVQLISAGADIDQAYFKADPASGLVFVPALAGFAAPHWDGAARGMIVGLHRGSTREDIVRAMIDGIANTITDVLEVMRSASNVDPVVIRADGGLSRSDALLQAQADMMGVPVSRSTQTEHITARGAAWMAGIRFGIWSSPDEASSTIVEGKIFQPKISEKERSVRRDAWRDAVNRDLGWRIASLS